MSDAILHVVEFLDPFIQLLELTVSDSVGIIPHNNTKQAIFEQKPFDHFIDTMVVGKAF